MQVFICEQCSAEVLSYPSKPKRFCSQSCAGKWRAENVGMPTKPKRGEYVPCATCAEPVWRQPSEVTKRFCSKKCRNASNKVGSTEICEACGEDFWVVPSQTDRRFCSRSCYESARTKRSGIGRQHNGREVIRDHAGYLRIWEPDHPSATQGRILEHRWIIEQSLGRHLLTAEHVHHVNGIKDDNRIENLEVLSHAEHSRITGNERAAHLAAVEAELAQYRERYGPLTT